MNDQELEKMVLDTYRITKDNRDILRRIESRQRLAEWGRVIKFLVFLAVVVAIYVLSKPYWGTIQNEFDSLKSAVATVQPLLPQKSQ